MGGAGCGVVLLLTKQFVNKILFGGNLGKVFDMDWEPYFGPQLALENFSHLMTVTSGGVEVSYGRHFALHIAFQVYFQNESELDASEVECWEPSLRYRRYFLPCVKPSRNRNPNPARTVERISRLCPRLQRLKILANDVSFRKLEQLIGIEEVIILPFTLSVILSNISRRSWRLT